MVNPKFMGLVYVLRLRHLGAACEEYDKVLTISAGIDSASRSEDNPPF